jgi:hypothetical protein
MSSYTPKAHYTADELDHWAIRDLEADVEQSEQQAVNGPFFPDRGITAESLLAYAAKCRAKIEQYRNGGAHKAVLAGS